MPDYDFKQLSPHEFELLSRDLLQKREDLQLESFKTGRDGGIDFRFAQGANNIVVQCKHYVGTGLSGLVSNLKKEAVKAASLNPTRYILVTSVPLSPANKKTIQGLFPDILVSSDVIGSSDLNNLLSLYEEVEGAHYKLWLASRAVLDRVINNAELTQSEFDVDRIYRDVQRYVMSEAYPRAIDILTNDHFVIVSGQPGVGKTTLARMLVFQHLERGFEVVSMQASFQAGRKLFKKGKKQIFYFDDFMGSTFLGERGTALTRNEDRQMLDFIEIVRGSKNARLILTTRDHILQQALEASEKMKHSGVIDQRCVLEVTDYSDSQRAEILYNHVFFSKLPKEYQQELLENNFYFRIIRHSKFNPRLIEWLSDYRRVRKVSPESYQRFVVDLLDDPAEIWRFAYEEQISDSARDLLLALYSLEGSAGADLLERALRRIRRFRAEKYNLASGPGDLQRAYAELRGSFIRLAEGVTEVIDPSVLDLLNATIHNAPDNAIDIVMGAVRFEQLSRIWSVAQATGGESVLKRLVDEIEQIAPSIERLLDAPHKKSLTGGGASYEDDAPEKRLAILVSIAQVTKSNAIEGLVSPYSEKLFEFWDDDTVRILGGAELIRTLNQDLTKGTSLAIKSQCLDRMLDSAVHGCLSFELEELIDLVNLSNAGEDVVDHLRHVFSSYCADSFEDELDMCSSVEECDSVSDSIEIVGDRLDVETFDLLETLNERRQALGDEEYEEDDYRYEQWKERSENMTSGDSDIQNMFDSLK